MINYNIIGEGEPIIFIHGLGQSSQAWNPQIELSEEYRLILPDLRGHGRTEINDNITLENMALDIIELIEHLHIDSVHIVGLSLGGLVAQEVYKQRSSLVKSLILSNTCFYIPAFFANSIVGEATKLFYENKNELIRHIVNRSLNNKDFTDEAIHTFYLKDSYLEAAVSGIEKNYTSTLLNINVPTLLIGSAFDQVTPVFNIMTMNWMIRNSEMTILHSGHLSNIECREQFNNRIRKFIA
jgi:pimeloyl-ACP methyl ester carboxylesterase